MAKVVKARGGVKAKIGGAGAGAGGFEVDGDRSEDEAGDGYGMGDGDEDEDGEYERMAQFGDVVGGMERHVHEWGRAIEDPGSGSGLGIGTKRCVGCGMEVEELEF